MLWAIHWPTEATVTDYLYLFLQKVEAHLKVADVNLVFDKYNEYSIKSSTRANRAKQVSKRFVLTEQTPLPPQTAVLTNSDNKKQLIDLLCVYISKSIGTAFEHRLVITNQELTPIQIHRGHKSERSDLKTQHEEADIVIVQQILREVNKYPNLLVHVLCDDTDVFVLLLYYYLVCNLNNEIYMKSFRSSRSVVDIKASVLKHKDIINSLPAAHSLTGCDTVATLYGIGKKKAIKCLQMGLKLEHLGHIESSLDDVIKECTTFIASCYGVEHASTMTEARISLWAKKIGKSQLKAPQFSSFPPTSECFAENVKRAHYQTVLWLSANNSTIPDLDPTLYGWEKDGEKKSFNQ